MLSEYALILYSLIFAAIGTFCEVGVYLIMRREEKERNKDLVAQAAIGVQRRLPRSIWAFSAAPLLAVGVGLFLMWHGFLSSSQFKGTFDVPAGVTKVTVGIPASLPYAVRRLTPDWEAAGCFPYKKRIWPIYRRIQSSTAAAMGYLFLAEAQMSDGMGGEVIASRQKASRLDPESEDFYAGDIGFADLFMGRDQEAVPLLEKFTAIYPNQLLAHLGRSVAYIELGNDREARAQAAEVMRLNPQFRCDPPEKFPNKDPVLAKRLCADLRKVG